MNRGVLVFTLVFLVGVSATTWSTEGVQPKAAFIVTGETDELYFSMLQAQIEYRLSAPARYDLVRMTDDREPEEVATELGTDAAVFLRLVPRRDGSLRVEADVWSRESSAFSWSDEFELEDSSGRFVLASGAASDIVAALDDVFGSFAVVEFENRGYQTPCEIVINGESFGASLLPVGLVPGRYEVAVQRQDDLFGYTVAKYDLELLPDDYIRLVFELDRNLPMVPGLVRLSAVTDPWVFGMEVNGGVMIPMGAAGNVSDMLWGSYISVMTKGLLVQDTIWGIETGYTQTFFGSDDSESTISVANVPVMIFTGFQLGPVSVVDFVFRVGGGLNLGYLAWDVYDEDSDSYRAVATESIAPVVRGVFEFGIRIGKRGRISIGAQETTVIEKSGAYSWMGLQTSFGVRM